MRELVVRRTWTRDGSHNDMPLWVAVKHLRQFNHHLSEEQIEGRLLRAWTMKSRLAEFYLARAE